jgi:CBS domain-containing protein
MSDEFVDEELGQMYEEGGQKKVLDSSTFRQPIKRLRVGKPVTLAPTQTVAEALAVMRQKRIGCVVVTEKDRLKGILTERDILLKVAGNAGSDAKAVREIMTPDPEVFQPEDSIAFVLNAMHVGGYRHVPVVDEGGKPIAVISVKDIVGFILDHFAEDVLNLPPKPVRTTDQREGA